jgi:(2R)-ethylmalonyl-CoA mutase
VVVGGIIPEQDVPALRSAGVSAVYTPKDFDITRVMREIVALVQDEADRPAVAAAGARVDGAA